MGNNRNHPLRVLHSEYEARLKSPEALKSPRLTTNSAQSTSNAENCAQRQQPDTRPIVTSPTMKTLANLAPRRSKCIYSDRFIPTRLGASMATGYDLLTAPPSKRAQTQAPCHVPTTTGKHRDAMCRLLQSEFLGMPLTQTSCHSEYLFHSSTKRSRTRNLFRFQVPGHGTSELPHHPLQRAKQLRIAAQPTAKERKIAKVPFKILDAPALQDDFYVNVVDWSAWNVLAVGLGAAVYLWSACTSKVTKLCDFSPFDTVASVTWTQRGSQLLAVGTNSGLVQIWDTVECKLVRTMLGHLERVGTLAWSSQLLATGSRDKTICLRDIRIPADLTSKLQGHSQELCGLKWSFDDQQLASGGNDNNLLIWNCHAPHPLARFTDHTAAVKALAWSPHTPGLIASGGGTADRCIRFWNTLQGTPLHAVDTGSQVCNLLWSKNSNEVVSTHGYSLNQVIVWKYPTMQKVATLTGHTYRVLYLSMSPDGQTIVTGAGDETLRFWNAFPTVPQTSSLLFPSGGHIR
ncbi:hypothetical protein Ae201684_004917 [Aphanomyces euteiches]|uniref:CDC20/Fizzy WD40 domain-containing protein n=1 Tax=Aphanomyces euteiches TaxID=100861 RepID=A0A6G0XGU0_9STRA|nr:hypothetical protein Ae201684_004917 [Aphanomyces euteiches]KAH9144883.1 hypothetical protein AeRB84_011174 [Aphanomyces euteiches]